MRPAGWLFLLAAGCAGGGGSSSFHAEFGNPAILSDFRCEVQTLHVNRKVVIKDQPPEAAKAGRSLVLEPGDQTIAWLYHFEDDGHALRDRERAFTIAVCLNTPEPGRYNFPSDTASIVFFCDNWGEGFRAAEARATSGWLDILEVDGRTMRGEMDIALDGYRERPDGTKETLGVRLAGHFSASR